MTGSRPAETPLFLDAGGTSLFAVYHERTSGGETPFVFCHPFAEEKLWTHRVYVTYARQLASAGHPVLRFDYRGNGDSGGEFSESSLDTVLADVGVAIDWLRQATGAPCVNLLGVRLGATIAALTAEARQDVERLILWAPVVDGARYMQELLRVNLTTQMAVHKEIRHDREALVAAMQSGQTVNVDGYEMAYPMFEQVSAVKLAMDEKRHPGPTLIVQIEKQPGRPPGELQTLAATYGGSTLAAVQEEPFWKEIQQFYQRAPRLFSCTDDWLRTGR